MDLLLDGGTDSPFDFLRARLGIPRRNSRASEMAVGKSAIKSNFAKSPFLLQSIRQNFNKHLVERFMRKLLDTISPNIRQGRDRSPRARSGEYRW